MIVCVCRGVTDRQIRQEAAAGHALDEVFRRTGAGSSCGTCRLAVARLVAMEHAQAAARAQSVEQAAQQQPEQDAA
ncbi:(2Fe-2S)-binding protein [Anaeromyxobacter oryzae]|uniref:Bacterioferritin-associated ferredoxin n=1 Tax=Anaeromyxobacter oryzae TaxID=2918170 RepID=A0ABM7WQP3_9BACT|nr:(2Fe-2S)-binding protein [Anaeromyxobacter oryzae]BDG01787.1 hypothetical protein AMOR_07830 [Anaeromyxobacter oryzae]